MTLSITPGRFDVISTAAVLHIEQKEIRQSDLAKASVSFPPAATELRDTRDKHVVTTRN